MASGQRSDVASAQTAAANFSVGASPERKLRLNGLAKVAVATTFLLITTLILYARLETYSVSFTPAGKAETSSDHPYRLHPEDHVFRSPSTIHHTWNITADFRRPDGVLKRVHLINGEFPGPNIEARSGDRVIVDIHNALDADEGVAVHWHGLAMRHANDMDGAVGLTQDAIPAGASFTYNFTISDDQSGTFWYHAHNAVQRADGLFGGFIVHEPGDGKRLSRVRRGGASSHDSPMDDHLVLLGDWYHRTANDVLGWYLRAGSFGMEPVPDSILVNGKGGFNCSNAVPARPLDCQVVPKDEAVALKLDGSRRSKLRVVNVGVYSGASLRVAGASMRAVAVDGGNAIQESAPVESFGLLQPGERVDLIVDGYRGPDTTLEVSLDTKPFKYPNPALTSTHQFSVAWEKPPSGSGLTSPSSKGQLNLADLVSPDERQQALPSNADLTFVLYTTTEKLAHLDNVPHGVINRTIWAPQSPPLSQLRKEQWNKDQLVPKIAYDPDQPLMVDIVLNNLDEENHPFHFHGYSFWVLSTHSSTFNWGSFNPFDGTGPPGGAYNLKNPVKKDTVVVPRRGYAVLRFRADNPGIWMFHCHVLWHQASGMAMGIEVG